MLNTEEMDELSIGMSNFDRSIDDGFAEALQDSPGKVFGRHSGYNFNGRVYFCDGQFHEEIWVHGSRRETVSADTLQELMDEVCDRYGSE